MNVSGVECATSHPTEQKQSMRLLITQFRATAQSDDRNALQQELHAIQ